MGDKAKLILVGSLIVAAAIALFIIIISFAGFSLSLTDIQFFFLNNQEISINGKFVDCVPHNILDICQQGFQSNKGEYFLLTNMQEIFDKNPNIRQELDQGTNTSRQFQISGTFTYGTSEEYTGFEVVGMINVHSITLTS